MMYLGSINNQRNVPRKKYQFSTDCWYSCFDRNNYCMEYRLFSVYILMSGTVHQNAAHLSPLLSDFSRRFREALFALEIFSPKRETCLLLTAIAAARAWRRPSINCAPNWQFPPLDRASSSSSRNSIGIQSTRDSLAIQPFQISTFQARLDYDHHLLCTSERPSDPFYSSSTRGASQ